MLLQQVLDNCISGELQNINIMNLDKTEVNPYMLKQFITVLNAGLTDLHTRFMLKKEAVKVRTRSDVRLYNLIPRFAISQGNPDAYIMDLPEIPFKGNIIEILEVYKGKQKVAMNVKDGVYITTPQTIYLDGSITGGEELDIIYKANHVTVPSNAEMTTEILIPPSHLQALSYFIGARMMTPQTTGMAAIEGRAFHEGSHYMKLYEAECIRLVELGIDADSVNVISLFSQRGFI